MLAFGKGQGQGRCGGQMQGNGISPTSLRIGGLVFLICGAVLVGLGLYLFTGILRWRITPDGAGLSTLWLLLTGAVTVATGGEMLALARRPRWLLRVLLVLIAVFVMAGVIVTLWSDGRMPRLYL